MFHSETEPDEAMRPILALEITARERECLLCETILSELHAQGSSIYYTGKRRHLMTPPPHHPAPQARIDARLAKEPREHTRSKESDTDATSTGVFKGLKPRYRRPSEIPLQDSVFSLSFSWICSFEPFSDRSAVYAQRLPSLSLE